jgi:hypothetical protein
MDGSEAKSVGTVIVVGDTVVAVVDVGGGVDVILVLIPLMRLLVVYVCRI